MKEIVAKRNLEDAVFTVDTQQNTQAQTLRQMPQNRNIEDHLNDKTDMENAKHDKSESCEANLSDAQ